METKDIAKRLYELCSQNQWEKAQQELFASHAKSIEPSHSQGPQVVEGLDNIAKKGEQFSSMVEEMYGGHVNEPTVYGNYISMEMGMDVKMKGAPRSNMSELAVYKVEDGKIVSEQFFF